MLDRFSRSTLTVAIAAAALGGVALGSLNRVSAQTQAANLKTPWGEPDLQGIWTVEYDTPFQRSPKYANREFFTEAERAEFDRVRAQLRGRDNRNERGSEADVAGAYNAVWGGMKRTGKRTSAVVDPPNGRIPSLTPEAQKIAAADQDFRLALMQSTQTCNLKLPGCAGG